MCMQYFNRYSEVFTYYLTIIIITADFNIRDVLNSPFPKFVRKCSLHFHFDFDIVPDLGLRLYSYMFNFIYINLHLNLFTGLRDNLRIVFYSTSLSLPPSKILRLQYNLREQFFQNFSIILLLTNGTFQIKTSAINVALLGSL